MISAIQQLPPSESAGTLSRGGHEITYPEISSALVIQWSNMWAFLNFWRSICRNPESRNDGSLYARSVTDMHYRQTVHPLYPVFCAGLNADRSFHSPMSLYGSNIRAGPHPTDGGRSDIW